MHPSPALLVFHPAQWDPARAEQVKAYSRTVAPRLIPSSDPKGAGEIGITGVAASIANAVSHATGKRVRDLPIRLEQLL